MLIDWFTVGAQLANFLVLLWLLKRFLYKPIVNAITAREKRIADELADAQGKNSAAERTRVALLAKTQDLDAERSALLAKAAADAAGERDRLLAQTHAEIDDSRLKQQTLLHAERLAQSDALVRLVSQEVFAIARRALSDLAGADLEERILATLLVRLRDATAEVKNAWKAAARATPTLALVRSRFELTAASRALTQTAVNVLCSAEVALRFESATDGLCGIEVILQGHKISWTLADYVSALEKRVAAVDAAEKPRSPATGASAPAPALPAESVVSKPPAPMLAAAS